MDWCQHSWFSGIVNRLKTVMNYDEKPFIWADKRALKVRSYNIIQVILG